MQSCSFNPLYFMHQLYSDDAYSNDRQGGGGTNLHMEQASKIRSEGTCIFIFRPIYEIRVKGVQGGVSATFKSMQVFPASAGATREKGPHPLPLDRRLEAVMRPHCQIRSVNHPPRPFPHSMTLCGGDMT